MANWNITAEVIRREYGFSDRAEIRARDSNPFHKTILGSHYLVKQIVSESSHICERDAKPKSLDFNAKGNLLCVGYDDMQIVIYDWAYDKLKFSFNSEHTMDIADVKFTNNDDSSLSVISTGYDGQIRRAYILPTGDVASTCLYDCPKGHLPKLAAVPRSPNEFVGVTTFGFILQLDLRCDPKVLPTIQHIVPNIYPHCVAHHPFAAEFCVGGSDAFLRIFDKRKINEGLRIMYPAELKDDSDVEILQCTYNYDGSEILANYYNDGAYLFNNQNYTAGEYLSSFSKNLDCWEADFFGSKSEFVICAALNGVCVFNKNTKEMIYLANTFSILKGTDDNDDDNFVSIYGVRSHPFLPVIASKTDKKAVILWAPAKE